MAVKTTIENNEPKPDFNISGILLLRTSSSSDPSNTIRISPMVPNDGKSELKSGVFMFSHLVASCANHPVNNKIITVGILILDENTSKI